MPGVVNRGLVHQDEVLVHSAAAHAEARRAFAWGLHAGHHLYYLDDVRLAEEYRDLLYEIAGKVHQAGLRAEKLLAFGDGGDGSFRDGKAVLLHGEVLDNVAFETDFK